MESVEPVPSAQPGYSLWELTRYMTKLGTTGFGGPVALVGYMHRDLVEDRRWISEADYKEGLTLSQLMPGPLAAQLAIYLGYVHYGILERRWWASRSYCHRSSWSSPWGPHTWSSAG